MQLIAYGLIALAIMGAIGTGVYKVKQWGGDEVRAEWAAANEAARQAAAKQDLHNFKNKERADAENSKTKRDLDGVYAAYRSLRDSKFRSFLPQAPAGTPSPATACFDRSALDRGMAEADGILQRGAEKILRRGDEAITDLNTARKWAQEALR